MESDLGKLFIGGISWDTDEERLREYFSKYGEVVEAVIMRDRATGRARGFGFIVFADPSVAERVIMEKHIIDGRSVEAKKAVPRDDQQVLKRHTSPIHHMSSPGHGGGGRTKKIFVGGLPSSITEAEFKNYFDQFGTISDVVVMYDHNTQRPRGFGFITYDSEDAVDRVLHKSFHELNGKMVEVKRAVPKELSPAPNRSPILGYGGSYGGGSNRSSANSYFNNFPPGYNVNSVARFSPVIGSGRTSFASGYGLGVNPELSLNPSYGGTASTFENSLGYGRILSSPYYNRAASPNHYSSPIGFNRTNNPPPAYNSGNARDLWENMTDSAGSGWNPGVSGGNSRGNWGLPPSVASDNNGYARNFGLSASPFSGTSGFESSVGEIYRGGSVYSDSPWQQPPPHPPQSSHELDGSSSLPFSYGIDNVGSELSANGSEGYTGSYNIGNRQANRGIAA